MRNTPNVKAERHRILRGELGSSQADGNNGGFLIQRKGFPDLLVIVSDGEGWDHVSVSTQTRTPTWEEMCLVKELFFREDEWVIQYHPPTTENINNHRYCLHLWRPQTDAILTPPAWMVGVKDLQTTSGG